MTRLIALLLAASLPATLAAAPQETAREDAALDRLLAGRVAGKPTSCIQRRTNQNVTAYGDGTLVYGDREGTIYRNDPPGGCPGASRDGILVTRSTIGQICRGDIIDVVDRASRFSTGSCVLGDFVPYEKAGSGRRRP